MLEAQNKLAILKQQLSELSLEKEYFDTYFNESHEAIEPYRSLRRHKSDTVMEIWVDYQRTAETDSS